MAKPIVGEARPNHREQSHPALRPQSAPTREGAGTWMRPVSCQVRGCVTRDHGASVVLSIGSHPGAVRFAYLSLANHQSGCPSHPRRRKSSLDAAGRLPMILALLRVLALWNYISQNIRVVRCYSEMEAEMSWAGCILTCSSHHNPSWHWCRATPASRSPYT
jgi:hypothetical protein